MTKFISDDVFVQVNGVDLSDHADNVDTGDDDYPAIDVTGMGASARVNVLAKAKTSTITVEFFQDWAAAKVNATLAPLHGSNSPFTVIVRPTSATASSTNPQATLVALLPKYKRINAGGVGQASKVSVEFVCGDTNGIVWTP